MGENAFCSGIVQHQVDVLVVGSGLLGQYKTVYAMLIDEILQLSCGTESWSIFVVR